jgi:hypothetical protein
MMKMMKILMIKTMMIKMMMNQKRVVKVNKRNQKKEQKLLLVEIQMFKNHNANNNDK